MRDELLERFEKLSPFEFPENGEMVLCTDGVDEATKWEFLQRMRIYKALGYTKARGVEENYIVLTK